MDAQWFYCSECEALYQDRPEYCDGSYACAMSDGASLVAVSQDEADAILEAYFQQLDSLEDAE